MFIKFLALHKLENSESIKRGISRNFFVQISCCKSSVRFGFGLAELEIKKFGSAELEIKKFGSCSVQLGRTLFFGKKVRFGSA